MGMLEISMTAIVMIIIGVVIRSLFINQIPKITFVMIWGLVVARLLIPFSIPTPVSVWDLTDRLEMTPVQNLEVTGELNIQNEGQVPQASQESSNQSEEIIKQVSQDDWVPIAGGGTDQSRDYLRIIWGLGMVISGLYFIANHYKFRKEMADSLPIENEFARNWLEENQLRRKIQVRRSVKTSSPLTYGILKPVILIPKVMDWQDEKQLKYILTHEYVHILQLDYLKKIVLAITLCVHWFNPMVWVMYVLANRDIELTCDEMVLKRLGQKAKSAYALILINMEEQRNHFVLSPGFSKNAIEERVQVMIKMKRTSILGAIFALLLVGATMTIFASTPENESHLSTPETYEAANGRFSIMNYASFEEWIDEEYERQIDLGVLSEEEINRRNEWHEEVLEFLKDGVDDMVIVDNHFEDIGVQVKSLHGYEIVTLESFSLKTGELLVEAEESNRVTSWELERMRENFEIFQTLINDGATVLLSMESWMVIVLLEDEDIFEICPIEEIDFENYSRNHNSFTFSLNLNYSEFEQWIEERIAQMAASGEYSERDIDILQIRYDENLEWVRGDQTARVRINSENEIVNIIGRVSN